jgi:hypothetical protein
MNWLRRHKKAALAGGAAVIAVIAVLAFGVFGVHTLFIDDKVSEANPFEDSTEATETTSDTIPDSPLPTDVAEEVAAEPEIVTLAAGRFEGREHPSEGVATVITDGDQTFLRFEDDFATDNGPDLNVYLSTAPITADSGAFDDDFVDLGDLKGNIGSQNYELDDSIDISGYQTVVIWCVRFGVAFGAAPLA